MLKLAVCNKPRAHSSAHLSASRPKPGTPLLLFHALPLVMPGAHPDWCSLAVVPDAHWLWWLQANELLGLGPGEVFVQRNVGNLVGAGSLVFSANTALPCSVLLLPCPAPGGWRAVRLPCNTRRQVCCSTAPASLTARCCAVLVLAMISWMCPWS